MGSQVQQLMKRLRDSAFREGLLQLCTDATAMASSFYNGDVDDPDYKDLEGDWRASLELAMSVQGWLPDVVNKPAQSLSNPRIVASDELWDEFAVYLQDECYGISDETYDAYLDHIEHRLLQMRSSESFALCDLSFAEDSQKVERTIRGMQHGILLMQARLLGNISEDEVKESAAALFAEDGDSIQQQLGSIGDFQIGFRGVEFQSTERLLRKPDPDRQMTGTVQVQLSGHASERAIRCLVQELAPLAQSHFRSATYLESKLSPENFHKYLAFGVSGLEVAILNTSNKDTFQRRIANAVRLLAEADRQQSDPIGLSLCVTAIDALLGRKGQEMTKTLADFVAGLLEPEVAVRRKAADYVADLYEKRSRVLHGDSLDGSRKLRDESRQLAASVLWGVWSYQDFFERFYAETPKPDEFFRKLRDEFVKPGLPDGVLALPVRELWQAR